MKRVFIGGPWHGKTAHVGATADYVDVSPDGSAVSMPPAFWNGKGFNFGPGVQVGLGIMTAEADRRVAGRPTWTRYRHGNHSLLGRTVHTLFAESLVPQEYAQSCRTVLLSPLALDLIEGGS